MLFWQHHQNQKKENCSRNCSFINQQPTTTAVTWTKTTTTAAAVWTTATIGTTITTRTKKLKERKNPESYKKRVPHPLEQAPEKIESFIPPSVTRTVLAAPKNITPSAKCKSCKKKSWKKARLQKQLHENTEKVNVIKKLKLK